MAVVRMIGSVSGQDIIFHKDDSEQWLAVVPSDLYGELVVEVKAYDEAGNYAYSSSMLFIVDKHTLEVRIIPLQFAYLLEDDKYHTYSKSTEYAYHVELNDFAFQALPQNYTARVV